MENPTLPQKPGPNFLVWIAAGVITLATGIGVGLAVGKYSSSASIPSTCQCPDKTACPNNDVGLCPEKLPEGSFCGGIAAIMCPDGYKCKYDGNYPDASGSCVKTPVPVNPISNRKTSCEQAGGKWLEKYKECENIESQVCKNLGGNFNECDSPCRNDPTAGKCITLCVAVCKFP